MFWRSVCNFLDFSGDASRGLSAPDVAVVNPATGLPMLDNSMVGIDVGGSPYGTDTHLCSTDNFASTDLNPWD